MNITVLIIELIILAALFSALILTLITKDPESFVTDYPPEIREVYYQTHEEKKETLTKAAVIRKVLSMVVALFVFAWMAHLAGCSSYISASLTVFLYIAWIAAYDTFFLDWVLFPRVKRWRLPGTEHMDKEYAQKWFHLKEVLKISPLGIAFALIAGLVFILIF